MTLVKLRYNSKLVPDPGLVLQTPLWNGIKLVYFQKGFGRKTTFPKFLNGIRNQIKSVNYFDVSTDQRNIYLGGFHGW